MASYHFAIKTSRNCAAGADLHYDYITREGKYSLGKKAEELVCVEHGNMPSWAIDNPNDFWKASEDLEGVNRTTYREIELALPNELNVEANKKLVDEFVQKHIGNDFIYSYAIHSNEARLAKNVEQVFTEKGESLDRPQITVKNPHVHIMICERKLDGIDRDKNLFFKRANTKQPELGGAKKDEIWNGKNRSIHLTKMRESWSAMQNIALERAGHKQVKVDHRTLEEQRKEALNNGDIKKAQELDRMPEKHLGPKLVSWPKSVNIKLEDNDKVRYVILSREYKKLLEETRELKEKIEASKLQKNNTNDYKEDIKHSTEINITVEEIKRICDNRIKEINTSAEQLRLEHKEALKNVISPERANLMAISVYTKGQSKQLNIEARKLKDEVAKFDRDRKLFLEKPKPSFYQVSYKEEYNKEAERLLNWQKDLTNRVAMNDTKLEELNRHINSPEAQVKIKTIQESILKKNEPARKNVENISARIKAMRIEKDNIIELKKNFSYTKSGKAIRIVPPAKNNSEIESILKQSNKIINQLKDDDNAVSLSARLRMDDEEERKLKHHL